MISVSRKANMFVSLKVYEIRMSLKVCVKYKKKLKLTEKNKLTILNVALSTLIKSMVMFVLMLEINIRIIGLNVENKPSNYLSKC